MRKLKLVRIENFKNLKKFVLTVNPTHTEFVAPNAFGKTSIADAISWVMTGKLYNGSSDIMAIKPKDNPSALVSVELVFDDDTSIMKTYQENWVKTRGSTEMKLEGHTTNCYINGLAIPVTKFDEELKKLFNINYNGRWKGNIFQLLIDPTFFGMKLEWQDRRTIVMDLVGDVTDDDVFTRNSSLLPLKHYLSMGQSKIENTKKILNQNLKKANEEEKKLSAQIEVLDIEPTVTDEQYKETVVKLEELDKHISELTAKKFASQSDLAAERNNLIAELKTKLAELKERDQLIYQEEVNGLYEQKAVLNKQKQELNDKLIDVRRQRMELEHQIAVKKRDKDEVKSKIETNEQTMVALKSKYYQLKEKKDQLALTTLTCPTCGQPLPKEQETLKMQEVEKNINEEMANIRTEGQTLKQENEELEQKILEMEAQLQELEKTKEQADAKYFDITNKIKTIDDQLYELIIPDITYSEDTRRLQAEIFKLEHEPLPETTDTLEIEKHIAQLQYEKMQLESLKTTYLLEHDKLNQAAELKQQRQETLKKIAEYESLQDMLAQFIKLKLDILNERVESVFGDIKFQLVQENLKEGSWDEVCWVLDGEVPYHHTNSAAKIRLGLKVCEAIKKRLDISGLFYIIDNAEQITDRNFAKLTNDQVISFVAYEPKDENRNINKTEQLNLFEI